MTRFVMPAGARKTGSQIGIQQSCEPASANVVGVVVKSSIAKINARMNGVPVFSLYVIIIILACAVVNYGAGRYEWMFPRDKADPQRTKRLPGRPLYYATAAIGAIAASVLPWQTALAVVAAFVAWRGPSWGHLFQLGHVVPNDRPMPLHERICMKIGLGNVYAAAAVRHSYMLPLAAVLPAAAAFPALTVAAYELAWRLKRPVVLAEPIVGALWGAIIITGVYL